MSSGTSTLGGVATALTSEQQAESKPPPPTLDQEAAARASLEAIRYNNQAPKAEQDQFKAIMSDFADLLTSDARSRLRMPYTHEPIIRTIEVDPCDPSISTAETDVAG